MHQVDIFATSLIHYQSIIQELTLMKNPSKPVESTSDETKAVLETYTKLAIEHITQTFEQFSKRDNKKLLDSPQILNEIESNGKRTSGFIV
jgi:hypothetical protein